MMSKADTFPNLSHISAGTTPAVPLEMRKGAHGTPAMLPNRGYLDVNGCIPKMCILDSMAIMPLFIKASATDVDIIM